jgi:hypothetical protein
MSADQPWWSRIRQTRRVNTGDVQVGLERTTDRSQAASPEPITHTLSPADSAGAMVARSQILFSGSTATLLGTMTNETGFDVHFSGTPPYARTLDSDGNRPVLLGDFNSPPREQPSSADWVMHPGASVPYRSLPITLKDRDLRWDGTDWCATSESITLNTLTFRREWQLPTIQIIT